MAQGGDRMQSSGEKVEEGGDKSEEQSRKTLIADMGDGMVV